LWLIFLLGLLGGLLAIFTPCVWPIIPMTVSFFLKRTDKGARNAILYGLSIIVLYVGLGLLVTILFGASALNDLSTNAIVNIFFFLLLVVFALSFFGLFEITLPDSWSTAIDNKARSTGGFLSILLMAFTLVIVSFSCTGPIIGTLLVEAAGHSLLAPAIGMLGFAIALALPFSLFAMFPQWMKQAPKSGDWMTSFKVVLAFLELALSLKFLSVADMAYGWGILPRWLFLVIWIACFAGIGIYLLWNIGKVTTTRKIIRAIVIIPSFAFAAYLVPGLWGAPVRAVSAFAPMMEIEGREVFYDYDEGMAYARQTGKPVVIDFTGYGCVNCRKMEAFVLADDSVKARLKNYVFIELYVDDRLDKDSDGESEGNENSRLQRERFGSNAQPFYVQLDAQGEQVGEPMAFTIDPMQFINWLKY
jgi:thiol:disulfide interchange protein DsbD